MHSLIRDMETFRNYLAVAEVCRCKVKKLELAKQATENCLKEVATQVNDTGHYLNKQCDSNS